MNLLKKNGCKFKARIDGEWCEGVIYVDGRTVYLMQNERDGSKPCPFPSELGFSCSWNVDQGTERIWSVMTQKTLKSLKIVL